jgi:hypothetical protein
MGHLEGGRSIPTFVPSFCGGDLRPLHMPLIAGIVVTLAHYMIWRDVTIDGSTRPSSAYFLPSDSE